MNRAKVSASVRFLILMGSVACASAVLAEDDGKVRIVAAWAAGPFECRVVFDRPVDVDLANQLVGRSIVFDESRPSVRSTPAKEESSPDRHGALGMAAARLEHGGRTLVLTTDPHPRAATYSFEIPAIRAAGTRDAGPLPIVYDLTGVDAAWSEGPDAASPAWTGWWPALDPEETRSIVRDSPDHAVVLGGLTKRGRLSLTTLVMIPKGPTTVRVSANVPFHSTLAGEEPQAGTPGVFRLESTGEPTLLTVALATGAEGGAPAVRVTYECEDDPKPRTLSRDRLLLPWVPAAPPAPGPLSNVPSLDGGDAARGAIVFKSVDAKCATCHKVRGEGENVGPDLTNLNGRDRLSVYRDIAEPSAQIRPDYVPYTVALKDGRILVGTVRAKGVDMLAVTDTEAKATLVPRVEVEELRPSATSIMPVGLVGAIGEDRLRDLIAFLTNPPIADRVDAAKK